MLSVIQGMGEVDILDGGKKRATTTSTSSTFTEKPYTDCPYLLLDVRDVDEFNDCHIIGGQ